MSIKKFYLLIICIFVKNSAQITLKKPTDAELVNYIKKVAAATMQQYQIPGMAIALYVHGKPYLFQFGFADKNKKLPVVATTIFEIGSITKIFTCLLLAQEVIDERMRLSDPIDVYIPTLSRNKKLQTITLEKLATHTSSLPLNAPPQIKTSEALRTHILHWQPVSGAPLSWQYSNHGIELLRIALEESLHKSFDQLVIDRILIPLGMSPIGTKISKDYQHDAAVGYDKQGNPSPAWHHPFLCGAGALRVSSTDMLNFLKGALGLPGTPAAIKKAMHLTQTPYVLLKPHIKYGLGWQINDFKSFYSGTNLSVFTRIPAQKINKKMRIFNQDAVFDKTGTTDGFHAYIAVAPSESTGIVVMINHMLPNGWSVVKKLGKEILIKALALKKQNVK